MWKLIGNDESMAADATALSRTRLARLIFAAAALGSTSLYAAFTAAVLAVPEIGWSRGWAGVPGATGIAGTALGSALLSRVMAARGRRVGLTLGWCVGAVGAVLAAISVVIGSFVGLSITMALLGIGHASNHLSRFAAADMFPEARRPAVLGWTVWAGTVGAVAGPNLLGPFEAIARAVGIDILTGGFLVAIVFYVAAIICAALLRPDPSEFANDDGALAVDAGPMDTRWRSPRVRMAILIMVTGQVAMIAIMTMTPLHIREHGHGVASIGLVMSAHFLGMFAFAPFIGILVARSGSIKVAVAGLSALIGAALGAAIAPEDTTLWIGLCLFLLGIGWCMGFVAGSALLTGGLAYAERVRMQGSADALVWTLSASASLASGVLLATFGYVTLAVVGAVVVVGPLLLVGVGGRRLVAATS